MILTTLEPVVFSIRLKWDTVVLCQGEHKLEALECSLLFKKH